MANPLPRLQVLPLPVLPLPAPVAANAGGPHLQLRGHPHELPGLGSDAPAAHQGGPEKAVQRAAQPTGKAPPPSQARWFHSPNVLTAVFLVPAPPLRAPRACRGPTRSTSTNGRSASTPSPTGLATCRWSTPSFAWTPCSSRTRCPSCARSTRTWRGPEGKNCSRDRRALWAALWSARKWTNHRLARAGQRCRRLEDVPVESDNHVRDLGGLSGEANRPRTR